MDPMKPADSRPSVISPAGNSLPYTTAWKETTFDPKLPVRKCPNCGSFQMNMMRRTVTGRDGDIHREYKVVCPNCQKATTVHWSKSLTQHEWNCGEKDES